MLFNNLPDDKLYRVCLGTNTNTIEVACIGIDRVDSGVDGVYASADELPKWPQYPFLRFLFVPAEGRVLFRTSKKNRLGPSVRPSGRKKYTPGLVRENY